MTQRSGGPAFLANLFVALSLVGGVRASAAETAAPPRTGMRYVYMIRHGMYDRVDSLDDRTANGLNALGREQARLLGERLRGLPMRPRLLVSSGLTRARETGDIVGAILGVPCARDSMIEECAPPQPADSAATAAAREEAAACAATLERAWERYMRPSAEGDAHDLLVCHGNVIRWFVTRALHADSKRWITMGIGNASITILAVRPDGSVRLMMFSDVGHLPVDEQTWIGGGSGWWTAPKK